MSESPEHKKTPENKEYTYRELLRTARFWDALMYAVQERLRLDYEQEVFVILKKIIELQDQAETAGNEEEVKRLEEETNRIWVWRSGSGPNE